MLFMEGLRLGRGCKNAVYGGLTSGRETKKMRFMKGLRLGGERN